MTVPVAAWLLKKRGEDLVLLVPLQVFLPESTNAISDPAQEVDTLIIFYTLKPFVRYKKMNSNSNDSLTSRR